jgi:hypothetical protein
MAVKQSAKAQVGGGLFVGGILLAFPGVVQIAQGAVGAGLALELIPAALIIGGHRLKKSGKREAA